MLQTIAFRKTAMNRRTVTSQSFLDIRVQGKHHNKYGCLLQLTNYWLLIPIPNLNPNWLRHPIRIYVTGKTCHTVPI